MINAGRLKDKIQIFRNTSTQNLSGGFDFVPVLYLSTFAEVLEVASNPDLIASQEDIKQLVKVTIRYRPDHSLSNGDVLEWRHHSLILNNFVVDPFRTKIEMFCTLILNTSGRNGVFPPITGTFDTTFDNTFK